MANSGNASPQAPMEKENIKVRNDQISEFCSELYEILGNPY